MEKDLSSDVLSSGSNTDGFVCFFSFHKLSGKGVHMLKKMPGILKQNK